MPDPSNLKFLIIQTAFIGDAILATAILEKLHAFYPHAKIDYLIRKGNEQLFENHPFINKLWVWDKKNNKIRNQIHLIINIRKERYDYAINCQRYLSSGLFSIFSGAKSTIGFDKNPVSFLFTQKVKHSFDGTHETERNQKLITFLTDAAASKPKLYPGFKFSIPETRFITISPSSVWFTKQFPKHKWIEFIDTLPLNLEIYLLGAPSDRIYNENIIANANRKLAIFNKAGEYSLLHSAAIMQKALMNYVNDSAPMHLCSAVNAPVCVVYCSTIPAFGYGPLSDISKIIQTEEKLDCRPCGIHGHSACPKGHFKCAEDIDVEKLIYLLEPKKISIDNSKVFYHQMSTKNASFFFIHSTHKGDEREKNIEIAMILADLGLEIKLLPNNIYPKELWEFLMPEGTKPHKHPDALINGEIFEFKTLFQFGRNTIDAEIRKAKEQADNILIRLPEGISVELTFRTLKSRFKRNDSILQIWILEDGILHKFQRDSFEE